jgi:hypothetical protein
MERKFKDILASGCPLANMAAQYCSPSVAVVIGGVFNHSSTGFSVDGVLNPPKLSKYLLRDDCGCAFQLAEEKQVYSIMMCVQQMEPPR